MSEKGSEEEKTGRPAESGTSPDNQDPGKATTAPKEKSGPAGETGDEGKTGQEGEPHPYEDLLDEYPLRDPSEDPVWSVRIVRGWMWFLAVTTGGLLLLLILGIWFD